MSQQVVDLLLGSNLGSRKRNIAVAVSRLKIEVGEVMARSGLMITEPVEFVTNNYFCNIALRIKTGLSPISLLHSVKKIEAEMGREQDSAVVGGYADRVIDIDIVRYGNIEYACANLIIPHRKHLYERNFSGKLLSELSKTLKT